MKYRTIKKPKMRCGSVCSCSLPVFTALFFLSGFAGFAQQNTVGSSLSPDQKKMILDQRVSYKARELKMDELVAEGVKLEMKQDYDMAIDKYLAAKKIADEILAVSSIPSFKMRSEQCASKIANAYFYWAQSLYKDAVKSASEQDYDRAIEKCRKAIEIYPDCKEKMEKIIEKNVKIKICNCFIPSEYKIVDDTVELWERVEKSL